MQNKKTLTLFFVLTVLAVVGAFFYITRPAEAPSIPADEITVVSLIENVPTGATLYRIVPGESSAEFYIGEILNGQANTVIGTTGAITGDIAVHSADPAKTTISAVRINARTLKTDSERRDGVVSRSILRSDQPENEFISFAPALLAGLPEKTQTAPFDFQITGDLSIAGVAQRTVWTAQVEELSGNQVVASAETTIRYADFGINIPQVPFVASVEDEVRLVVHVVARSI